MPLNLGVLDLKIIRFICSYIPGIHQQNGHFMDWTTYLTENPMRTYKGRIPNGPINQFYEVPAGEFVPGQKATIKFLAIFNV